MTLRLRVLKGCEIGNKGLYRKYRAYKKIIKISKFYFGPGSPKKRFLRFFQNFLRGKSGIRASRVRRRFRESRVRRRNLLPGRTTWRLGGRTACLGGRTDGPRFSQNHFLAARIDSRCFQTLPGAPRSSQKLGKSILGRF